MSQPPIDVRATRCNEKVQPEPIHSMSPSGSMVPIFPEPVCSGTVQESPTMTPHETPQRMPSECPTDRVPDQELQTPNAETELRRSSRATVKRKAYDATLGKYV